MIETIKKYIIGGYKSGGLIGVYWWIREHIYDKFYIINIKNVDGVYKWGWLDKDRSLLLACMKILCDFVEKELNCDYIDKEEENIKEILKIYKWWKEDRVLKEKKLEDILLDEKQASKEYWKLERKIYEEENEMLIKLIKLRKSLWT